MYLRRSILHEFEKTRTNLPSEAKLARVLLLGTGLRIWGFGVSGRGFRISGLRRGYGVHGAAFVQG